MLAYLKRNPLGNSALVAIFVVVFIYGVVGVFAEYSGVRSSEAGLLADYLIFPIILPLGVFVMFIVYRYLSKNSLAGEVSRYNYRPKERIVLGLIGLVTILTRYLAFNEIIIRSRSDLSGLVLLFWICIVGTRDWNIFEKVIWLAGITGLFVYIAL